tara:strand:- start:222 stop:452 length:231 start_codon:yes stop_codon:yes gene_type:complete
MKKEITLEMIEQEKFEAVKKSLGTTISKVCEWDGSDILDVLQIALEDSNFHSLNKELTMFRNTRLLETQMEYCKNI